MSVGGEEHVCIIGLGSMAAHFRGFVRTQGWCRLWAELPDAVQFRVSFFARFVCIGSPTTLVPLVVCVCVCVCVSFVSFSLGARVCGALYSFVKCTLWIMRLRDECQLNRRRASYMIRGRMATVYGTWFPNPQTCRRLCCLFARRTMWCLALTCRTPGDPKTILSRT